MPPGSTPRDRSLELISRPSSPASKKSRLASPPGASGTAPPPLHLDDEHKEGNFTIVSSDGITFRVNDYNLFWASSVFADASNLSADGSSLRRIEFTDLTIETAAVIRLFLKLVATLELDVANLPSALSNITNLLLFLRKWDCEKLFNQAFDKIFGKIISDAAIIDGFDSYHEFDKKADLLIPYPLHYFQIASNFDRPDICAAVIRLSCQDGLDAVHEPDDLWWGQHHSRDDTGSPFDSRTWTLQFCLEHNIPRQYMFALLKASPKGVDCIMDTAGEFESAIAYAFGKV